MTDPTRWRTDTTRRPAEAGVILRGARRPRVPGNGELARLDVAVADIPCLAAARARRWTRLASAAAASITFVALGTGVWAWRGLRPLAPSAARAVVLAARVPTPPAAVEAPDDDANGSWPAEAPVGIAPVRAPRAQRRSVARRSRPARPQPVFAAPVDTLVRETALIDTARERLATSPTQALAALEAHRRQFPLGQLAAEREFLAVDSLRRLGRTEEARARAASLAERFPSSSYAARTERLLHLTESPTGVSGPSRDGLRSASRAPSTR